MDYAERLAAGALRIINAKGMLVSWRAETPLQGEEWQGEAGAAPAAYSPSVVFLPPDSGTAASLSPLVGREAPVCSEYGLLAGGVGFEPKLTDVVQRNGVTLPIVGIKTYKPNGTPILHIVFFA
jgi:hypothetical protein